MTMAMKLEDVRCASFLEGEAKGEAKGITKGAEKATTENIRRLMEMEGWTFEKAVRFWGYQEK